jgi:hypothetical protein
MDFGKAGVRRRNCAAPLGNEETLTPDEVYSQTANRLK